MSSEASKGTIGEQIDAGHNKLDELHELLLVLKEDNAAQSQQNAAQSQEIAVLKTEINEKDGEIASLKLIVEKCKSDQAKLEEQKNAVAQTLTSNMTTFEKLRLAHDSAVLEMEKFKNQYTRLKRKVEMLADEIEEGGETKRAKTESTIVS